MAAEKTQAAQDPTKAFYDRISKAYDMISDSSEHTARERGLELLAADRGENVLVIGFGTGHSVVALGKSVGPTGQVFGVDVSEGMLDVAKKRLVEESVPAKVELSLGDARAMKYADGQFDAVFISFTLELFEADDIQTVLGEIRRVLRPGGRLGVVSLSREEHLNVAAEIYIWLHRHFPHFIDCQPIPVVEHVLRGGFIVDKSEKMSIWGLPVAIVAAHAS